jgi:hypothetical protein
MTKTRRGTVGGVVAVAVLGWAWSAAATESSAADQSSLMAPDARVRGLSVRIVAVINEATAQSKTFRGLVDQIGITDGIVYVAEGQCGHGVRACLLHRMTEMGPRRVLRILVDPQRIDRDLMRSIGHELQHAVEVLNDRAIRSSSAMTLLYNKKGDTYARRFETNAAIQASNAIHAELQERAAAERRE